MGCVASAFDVTPLPPESWLSVGLVFMLGVANFAMHRWVLESGDDRVLEALAPIRRLLGHNASYVLEYVLLALAMGTATRAHLLAPVLYGVYTSMSALTVVWLKRG